ncbi:MAG: FliH/SctL family protein [Armatimonadota bacterium]
MSGVIKGELLADQGFGAVRVIGVEAIMRNRAGSSKHLSPQETAASVIDRANEEAARIVSAARDEAEEIRAQAHREGRDEGLRQLDTERAEIAERAAGLQTELEDRLDRFWIEIEPELLKLSVDIAGKIVRHEVDEQQEFVLGTVKAGLKQLRDRHEINIRVNPGDYELLRNRKDDVACSCDGIRNLEVIDDRRVGRGGCVIESGHGSLDARIETQLGEVERALLEAANDGNDAEP